MLKTPDEHDASSAFAPGQTRRDATAGNSDAQFGLAFFLAAGPEPQNYGQALEWYLKAAHQNHRLAQFNLGQMYAQGQGMPRSDATALMWIRRAADGGDAGAQFNMGERCARTAMNGVEAAAMEARVEAYKWFTLAAGQDYRNAQVCSDSATMRMTREEVQEGNRRVQTFVAA